MAHVLVVDDDAAIRALLRDILEAEGHAVCVASRPAEALEVAARARPALVLLDAWLPGMDGRALLAAMRARGLAPRVLLLTAATDPAALVRELGADGHLPKPFEVDD